MDTSSCVGIRTDFGSNPFMAAEPGKPYKTRHCKGYTHKGPIPSLFGLAGNNRSQLRPQVCNLALGSDHPTT